MRYCLMILFALCFWTEAAQARGLTGDYSGMCNNDTSLQCWLEISNWTQVAIVVANRNNYGDKRCVISGRLMPSNAGLSGKIGNGFKLSLTKTGSGGVYMAGLPATACGLQLNGYYEAISN